MKEYMIHIWGGAFNSDANPSIEKDHGITEGYYYFNNKKELDSFCKIINKAKYKNQGMASEIKYGIMSHKRTIFVATFKYDTQYYVIHYDFGYEYEKESAEFMFLDGNYSCDCNRSLIIQREYGDDSIPELKCGERIKMLSYHIEYKD